MSERSQFCVGIALLQFLFVATYIFLGRNDESFLLCMILCLSYGREWMRVDVGMGLGPTFSVVVAAGSCPVVPFIAASTLAFVGLNSRHSLSNHF